MQKLPGLQSIVPTSIRGSSTKRIKLAEHGGLGKQKTGLHSVKSAVLRQQTGGMDTESKDAGFANVQLKTNLTRKGNQSRVRAGC